ncbi:MAG: isochorismatase family protein [bacterium]|nr:isochorismatase family protein [bacterium]
MNIKEKKPALLIIDVQKALDESPDGPLHNPNAEQTIVNLIQHWRKHNLPLFFVKYHSPRKASPFHKDAPTSQMKDSVKPLPHETVIIKHFEGAFMDTDLADQLKKANIHKVLFTGFYTDQCIAASSKEANNLGFEPCVVADGTSTTGCKGDNGKYYEAEDVYHLTLGALERDGITIVESSQLLSS